MPINSKQKGARAERQLSKALSEYLGVSARRSQQYCGASSDSSDIVSNLVCHLECKAVERLNLGEAYAQAKEDASHSGKVPIVCHKKNRGEWMMTLALKDLKRFVLENKHIFFPSDTI